MPELDVRWHLQAPGQPAGKTRCGLSLGGFTVNDVDLWLEHVHPGSCTLCMLNLDRSQKQYTKVGDAIREAVAPPAPAPAPPPPPEPAAAQASNETSASDVLVPDAPEPELELAKPVTTKKQRR